MFVCILILTKLFKLSDDLRKFTTQYKRHSIFSNLIFYYKSSHTSTTHEYLVTNIYLFYLTKFLYTFLYLESY